MPLTDTAIKQLKPGTKPYKVYDQQGLLMIVNPIGSKWWRFKYRYGGKEKLLALGTYPGVTLKQARDKRAKAKALLMSGSDPGKLRKANKAASGVEGPSTFEVVAREWFVKQSTQWVKGHADKIIKRLEQNVFPWIGAKQINEITAKELLSVASRMEERKAYETAHRAMNACSRVFRYAIATGCATRDPTADLRGALTPVKEKHYASITDPKKIGPLMRSINGYEGAFVTQCALRIAPMVFVRPGELRKGEWAEFNLDKAEWRIPAERMKMRELHIVPLSRQAVKVLRELHVFTGKGKYVFPGVRTSERPMSENTINAALRRLGYTTEEMTGHGFRSMASTLLNEQGFKGDWVERQLAHSERNSSRGAYNYAEYLPERRKMMQAWSNFLEEQANGIQKTKKAK